MKHAHKKRPEIQGYVLFDPDGDLLWFSARETELDCWSSLSVYQIDEYQLQQLQARGYKCLPMEMKVRNP